MPIYVYECKVCEEVFEVEQRITEDALTDCGCGAKGSLRRLIQPVGVVFNGAGFHINDYGPKSAASETTSPEAKPAEKAPTEAKPAAEPPAKSEPKAD